LEEYYLSLIRGDRRGVWPWLQRLGLRALSVPYSWGARARNTLLSRGYGARDGRNDEALVLEENLPDVPHLQGVDRVALARVALEELDSEVLVLDDGLQHRRLARDLDLVLVDATVPWGFGHLFPRGLLREPPGSLRRAHVVLLTRCDLVEPSVLAGLQRRIHELAPAVPVVETRHRPAAWINAGHQAAPLEALRDRQVAGFCGLGNPDAFRRTLLSLGMTPVAWRVFPDHHAYTRSDIESLRTWARQLPDRTTLVTTQKDLVKVRLDRLGDCELWALQIQLEVTQGKDVLEEKLNMVVGEK
jgi:tetraacyldisaccharide 4'-kinase